MPIPQHRGPTELTGVTFESQNVMLDGHRFVRCTFRDCRLTFYGFASCGFEDNRFEGAVEWAFAGPSELTLKYLSMLYATGVEGARAVVDDVIDKIRRSTGPRGPVS